jgi:hypothetical protein
VAEEPKIKIPDLLNKCVKHWILSTDVTWILEVYLTKKVSNAINAKNADNRIWLLTSIPEGEC